MQFEGNDISVNGINTRYYEAGQPHKRAMLLLHGGFGAALLHWPGVLEHLHDYYVIAPDLPGFGGTAPLQRMTIDGLVQWAHDLLTELGLDDVIVIGNGFGGLIARLLSAEYERDVYAVVLVNGGVIPVITPVARFVARLPLIGPNLFKRIARRMVAKEEMTLAIQDENLLTEHFLAQLEADVLGSARMMRAMAVSNRPTVTIPRAPTLLVWGEEDAITSRVVGEHIQKNIPESTLELIAETRNMPHYEAPDTFCWQVTNFIKQLEGPKIPD